MFIKAKVGYDESDNLSLINLSDNHIQRIDWIKMNDGKTALWVVTGTDTKGGDTGYWVTDLHIKDLAKFMEKYNLILPIERVEKDWNK